MSVEFDDALVRAALGSVVPRLVTANVDTGFVYTLVLRSGPRNSGFDVLRLVGPGPVAAEDVFVEIGFRSDLPGSNSLIRELSIHPGVVTPNGDGVNEQLEVEFVVLKVDSDNASIRIFDLTGRQVAELQGGTGSGAVSFAWPATDDQGQRVPPGLYLTSVEIRSQSGIDRVVRPIAVAY